MELPPAFGETHRAIQRLLPWYVTGRLDATECAAVEAHLAECAECLSDFEVENGLACGIARLSPAVDAGWQRLRERMDQGMPPGSRVAASLRRWFARPVGLGWLLAGQFASAALLLALFMPDHRPQPAASDYHTLASASAATGGNIVLMVQPGMPEGTLRSTLLASEARLVDGPTASGAYIVAVPSSQRDTALAALRSRPGVVLAQPLDAAAERGR